MGCIQFIASYFFVCKRYLTRNTYAILDFSIYQQHSGKELDHLARRKYLQETIHNLNQ
jgi:hypothetical protein